MSRTTNTHAPYQFHRAALQPLLKDTRFELSKSLVSKDGESEFLTFLLQQGLAPMWDKALETAEPCGFSNHFLATLHQARLLATGAYLIQRNRMNDIRTILDGEHMAHAVYKGAAVREKIYSEPALRPAADIDVLIHEDDKIKVVEAFQNSGYVFYGEAKSISHEANLVKGKSSIDLHWDIMRPGRTRVSIVKWLLEEREDCGDFWSFNTEGALMVMLMHPVFTKYSTTPQASLVRILDLVGLLEQTQPDWKKLYAWLERSGMQTAAWITLRWLNLLTGESIAEPVQSSLKPGRAKTKYLNYWLENNFSTRYLDKPAIVKAGFTLPAHDSVGDAVKAVVTARRLARQADNDLKSLQKTAG
ncbi:MAG: nucleotidyltransferase family protein [Halioglobus sp.]